jgi:hypothetical protein
MKTQWIPSIEDMGTLAEGITSAPAPAIPDGTACVALLRERIRRERARRAAEQKPAA